MKRQNGNHGFRTLGLLCLLLCALAFAPAGNAEAASAKSKALKAYKTFLANQETTYKRTGNMFSVLYLNSDSVPELYYSGDVYTFKKGKVRQIKTDTAGPITGYYKKTGVLVKSDGHSDAFGVYLNENTYYEKMSGTSTKCSLMKSKNSVFKPKTTITYSYWSWKNRKEISKSAFNKKLKSLVKNKKVEKITKKTHANTAANRKKYLK